MRKHGYRFLSGGLWIIAFSSCLILLLINLLYRSGVLYNSDETVVIRSWLPQGLACVVATGAALLLASRLPAPEKSREKVLFCVLTLIYGMMGFYLIRYSDHLMRADARIVYSAGIELSYLNTEVFEHGSYMSRFPHQLGLALYDGVISRLLKNDAAPFAMNLLFVIGINYIIYRITDCQFHDASVNLCSIALAFLFLPQFFFILLAYGLIPGLFFLLLTYWQGLLFEKTGRWRHLWGVVIFGTASVLLRKNYSIGLIALAIFLLLRALEKKPVAVLLPAR